MEQMRIVAVLVFLTPTASFTSELGRDSSAADHELEHCIYKHFKAQSNTKKSTLAGRGYCLDLSMAWLQEVNSGICSDLPYRFSLVESQSVGNLVINGQQSDEFKNVIHFFLEASPTHGVGESLLIDPSYLQFFNSIPSELVKKPIFVGKYEKMQDLRRKYSSLLRSSNTEDVEDENAGLYDTRQLFDFHYSRGGFSKGRQVIIP